MALLLLHSFTQNFSYKFFASEVYMIALKFIAAKNSLLLKHKQECRMYVWKNHNRLFLFGLHVVGTNAHLCLFHCFHRIASSNSKKQKRKINTKISN